MVAIERNKDEAKEYLDESIKIWEKNEEFKKIISLAAFAERWRGRGGGISPFTKMKVLKKTLGH